MDKLPTEILGQIFYHLYYHDKVQCMLVCHRFENHLKSTILFNSLCITSLPGFERTVKRLQQYPKNGLQIKNLRLDLKLTKDFEKAFYLGSLIQYLPNLKTFSCYGKHDRKNQQYPDLVFQPLNNEIEEFIDESERLISIPFLSSKRFTHLKKLTIKADSSPLNDIIAPLGNAPALTHLTIKDMTISFEDMELLHEALPRLETLRLEVTSLSSTRFPSDIVPATSVMSFSFTAIGFVPVCRQAEWVDYVRYKYTMLSNFHYTFNPNGYYLTDGGERYREWFHPLFFQLGPQLKTLSIDAKKIPMNLFEILDNAGCQIQHLTLRSITPRLIDRLDKSNQRRYIKIFQVKFKNQACQQWKNKSNNLNELTASYLNGNGLFESNALKDELKYDDILNMCNDTLDSLNIKATQINSQLTNACVYRSVRAFSLTNTNIPEGFDYFLTHSFPNLRFLKLINCAFNNKTLNLPNLYLSQLQIEEKKYKKMEYHIFIMTTDTQRCYSFDTSFQSLVYLQRNSDSYKTSKRSVPKEDMNYDPDLTVICASLDKAYVCHSI